MHTYYVHEDNEQLRAQLTLECAGLREEAVQGLRFLQAFPKFPLTFRPPVQQTVIDIGTDVKLFTDQIFSLELRPGGKSKSMPCDFMQKMKTFM